MLILFPGPFSDWSNTLHPGTLFASLWTVPFVVASRRSVHLLQKQPKDAKLWRVVFVCLLQSWLENRMQIKIITKLTNVLNPIVRNLHVTQQWSINLVFTQSDLGRPACSGWICQSSRNAEIFSCCFLYEDGLSTSESSISHATMCSISLLHLIIHEDLGVVTAIIDIETLKEKSL